MSSAPTEFDHVVVGAGSAGSPIVRRLVDAGRTVALIEAGGSDADDVIQQPNRMFELWGSRYDWGYTTEPQAHADGTVVEWPRGKVLGGSSSLYGLVYARGTAIDYDDWAYNGADGWGWADVLPYFLRSEDYEGGASAFHGVGGPLPVTHAAHPHVYTERFLQAAAEYGLDLTVDCNGPSILGAGTGAVNIRDGQRISAWQAFGAPVAEAPNLSVITGATALGVVIENGRAVGVRLRDAEGEERIVRSSGDIVLSAGTIGSTQLMLLSGLGPAEHLRAVGVDVVNDLPGVGENLHDHLLAPLVWQARTEMAPPTANWTEAHFFANSRSGLLSPDLQPIFVPAPLPIRGREPIASGFSMLAGVIRPLSRGTLRLRSADPDAAPVLDPNYLADPQDLRALRVAVEMCRGIVEQPPFDGYRGLELAPGPTTDEELDHYLRRQLLSYHHQVGTCRMGVDALSVVDPELRVHGVAGLRIADCSVMPRVPSANTHAAAVMIGERAADFLLAS